MESSFCILGVTVDSLTSDAPVYQVIQNGELYEETTRIDTALNVLSVLLARRIEVESYGR